ncbi:hypothetical protein TNCV_2585291 [Trichonephila clavipes]|nr:hypothetical protein TNCV_2585291 [Trichonephila clavipes]
MRSHGNFQVSKLLQFYKGCRLIRTSRNMSPERILRIDLTSPILPVMAFPIRNGEIFVKYASTHHGAQQWEAARRSSDMRQAQHLPQR